MYLLYVLCSLLLLLLHHVRVTGTVFREQTSPAYCTVQLRCYSLCSKANFTPCNYTHISLIITKFDVIDYHVTPPHTPIFVEFS